MMKRFPFNFFKIWIYICLVLICFHVLNAKRPIKSKFIRQKILQKAVNKAKKQPKKTDLPNLSRPKRNVFTPQEDAFLMQFQHEKIHTLKFQLKHKTVADIKRRCVEKNLKCGHQVHTEL